MVKQIGLLALALLPAALAAQNPQSAVGGEATVWVGGAYSTFNPDWGCANSSPLCAHQLMGPAAFGDFNLHDKWGIEAEGRWLHWGPGDAGGLYEDNYFIGPRDRVLRWQGLSMWIKLEMGGGWIQTPGYPAAGSLKGSYFAYAPGGTLEYRITPRLSIRGDYEFQIWPSFAGPPSYTSTGAVIQNNHGLTPNGFTIGLAYRLFPH